MVKSRKMFIVVAYDITDDKRRVKVIKAIEKYGTRINKSVYECMVTKSQYERLLESLEDIVKSGEDQIAIYPLCLDCYARTKYIPKIVQKDVSSETIV